MKHVNSLTRPLFLCLGPEKWVSGNMVSIMNLLRSTKDAILKVGAKNLRKADRMSLLPIELLLTHGSVGCDEADSSELEFNQIYHQYT